MSPSKSDGDAPAAPAEQRRPTTATVRAANLLRTEVGGMWQAGRDRSVRRFVELGLGLPTEELARARDLRLADAGNPLSECLVDDP
jgi:hypothetical protein